MAAQDYQPLPPLSEIFPYLQQDPSTLPPSIDPFTVNTSTGFLPTALPVVKLPSAFSTLTDIIDDMPIVKLDGSPGLLAQFKLGPLIDSGRLPDLTKEIDNLVTADGEADLASITAVFRDYSFLASSYLLEPCWERWSQDNSAGYGLGRQTLPKCIAGPLVKTAKMYDTIS